MAIRYIVAHQKEHGVSSSVRTIRCMMDKHQKKNEPIINKEWSGVGYPPKCTDADMKELAEECEKHQGKSYNQKEVKKMIKQKRSEKLEKAGVKEILEDTISDTTVRNYTALLADQANISITKSSVTKSNTRYAAENSIRGSIATAATIASTHFIPIEKEDPKIRAELSSLPSSTRTLINLVCVAWVTPVYPVAPEYIFSTNDTTEYIFEAMKDSVD